MSINRSTWRSSPPTTANRPTTCQSASVRVDSIAAGESKSVDIRLPIDAMSIATDEGETVGLHNSSIRASITRSEIVEADKSNNVAVYNRDNIPMVDNI